MVHSTKGTAAVVALLGSLLVVAVAGADTKSGARANGGPGAARAGAQGQIDPQADAVLKRMCDYVGGLKSLRVDTTTVDEKVTTTGQKVQEVKDSQVMMKRPNEIAVDRTGPAGHVLFRYDGRNYALYGVDNHVFASAPAPADLEQAMDHARDRYGIDAPGGDLIASDAYEQLLDGVTEGHYIGLEPIDGVMTHHVAMRKGTSDYQLWVADGPAPVPVRYVITSRDLPGQPQFTLELRHFQPNVPLSDASFVMIAPPGAQRVALGKPQGSHL